MNKRDARFFTPEAQESIRLHVMKAVLGGMKTGRRGVRVRGVAPWRDRRVVGGVSGGQGAARTPRRETEGRGSPQGVAGRAGRACYPRPNARSVQAPLCLVDARSRGGSGVEMIRGAGLSDDDESVVEGVGLRAPETHAPRMGTKPQGGGALAESPLSTNPARGSGRRGGNPLGRRDGASRRPSSRDHVRPQRTDTGHLGHRAAVAVQHDLHGCESRHVAAHGVQGTLHRRWCGRGERLFDTKLSRAVRRAGACVIARYIPTGTRSNRHAHRPALDQLLGLVGASTALGRGNDRPQCVRIGRTRMRPIAMQGLVDPRGQGCRKKPESCAREAKVLL